MMKLMWSVIVSALMVTTFNCAAQSLEGTWNLVSGEYVNHENKLVQYNELQLKSTKIISGRHFSFVTMSGDKFWSAGSGTYRISDEQYIESPELNSFNSPKGEEYIFDFKLYGDTWKNARWKDGKRVEFEIWQREH